MEEITQKLATADQVKQICRLGSDAIKKVLVNFSLDNPGAQRVIEHGDAFAKAISTATITSLKDLSGSDQYANEEASSMSTYPEEYQGPKPIEDQIMAITKIFNLDPSQALEFAKSLPALPDGAEGWFAIPSIDALAKKHFPEVTDSDYKNCQAVQLVHAKIAASRPFHNHLEGKITPAWFRVCTRTKHMLDLFAENQPGDILIIAAQLGMNHRGKSVRRARKVFKNNEFGLGAFAIGNILLTHPERLMKKDDLRIDCAGDEFSPRTDNDFSFAPLFCFSHGKIMFHAFKFDHPAGSCGSASGFLPQ